MSCTGNCNQGRNCTCVSPRTKPVALNLAPGVIDHEPAPVTVGVLLLEVACTLMLAGACVGLLVAMAQLAQMIQGG